MTIFLEIIKKFLDKEITKVRDASVEADASIGNTVVSVFGYGRDTVLSEIKRKLAVDLLFDFRNMKNKDNDLESCEHLKKLIANCKKDAKKASEDKSYDEGTFGPAMQVAIQLTQDIHDKLAVVHLLNIPHDDDPFNGFRYQMAHYFSKKIDDSRSPSILNNPKISSSNQVTKEKEQLVLEVLAGCEKDLKTLDIEHEDYVITRKKRVLEWIERLSRKNKAVCEDHTSTPNVPITLSLFTKVNISAPSIGPDVGFLDECLKAAVTEIGPVEVVENQLCF